MSKTRKIYKIVKNIFENTQHKACFRIFKNAVFVQSKPMIFVKLQQKTEGNAVDNYDCIFAVYMLKYCDNNYIGEEYARKTQKFIP